MKLESNISRLDDAAEPVLSVELFALCEAAFEHQGRLTVLKTFDRIRAPHLPATISSAMVAMRVRLQPWELDSQHPIQLRLVKKGESEALASVHDALTPSKADGETPSVFHLVFAFPQISFPACGDYLFEFRKDGELAGVLPLHVSAN